MAVLCPEMTHLSIWNVRLAGYLSAETLKPCFTVPCGHQLAVPGGLQRSPVPYLEARTTADLTYRPCCLQRAFQSLPLDVPFSVLGAFSFGKCFLVSSRSPICYLSPHLAFHTAGAWVDISGLVMTLLKCSRQHQPPTPLWLAFFPPESFLTRTHWLGHALGGKDLACPFGIPEVLGRKAHSVSWSHGTLCPTFPEGENCGPERLSNLPIVIQLAWWRWVPSFTGQCCFQCFPAR